MDVLVLGGTRFLGRHLVHELLARGDRVTLFHRGRSGAQLFEGEVERWTGDRDRGLAELAARLQRRPSFDAVVDTSGYLPRVAGACARLLRNHAKRYAFVSSVSAYADTSQPGTDEAAALAALPSPATEDIAAHYGALKAACENVVLETFGAADTLLFRPGLIVGPHDATDRFSYWVRRIAAGGPMLVPGPRERVLQFVDVRDAARFIVQRLAREAGGVWNVVGPREPMPAQRFVDEVARGVGRAAEPVWADPAWLLQQGVQPWTELPLWTGEEDGFMRISNARALADGLALRPLHETAADTLACENGGPVGASLAPAREQQLLAAAPR